MDNDQDDAKNIKDVFIDGQLSFKIRKTKNQDVMRKSLQNFKKSTSPKIPNQKKETEKVGKIQQQLLLRHKQQLLQNDKADSSNSLQFLNEIIKPNATKAEA